MSTHRACPAASGEQQCLGLSNFRTLAASPVPHMLGRVAPLRRSRLAQDSCAHARARLGLLVDPPARSASFLIRCDPLARAEQRYLWPVGQQDGIQELGRPAEHHLEGAVAFASTEVVARLGDERTKHLGGNARVQELGRT
eukprot:2076142-Pyramimonas_sp.AAC.1